MAHATNIRNSLLNDMAVVLATNLREYHKDIVQTKFMDPELRNYPQSYDDESTRCEAPGIPEESHTGIV